MNNRKKIFSLLFSQTKDFIFYTIFAVLSALLVIYEVLVIRFYIDNVIVSGVHENTALYVGLFLVGIVGFVLTIVLRSRTKTLLCSNVSISLTQEAYDSILYADVKEFDKKENNEKILKILKNSDDVGNVYLRKNFLKLYESAITVIMLFFAMLFIEPILSLFVLIGLPVYYVVDKGIKLYINKSAVKNEKAIKKINEVIAMDYKNIRSIKLMNSGEFEKANLDILLENYQKAKINKYIANNISNKALQITFNAIIIAIILGLCGFLSVEETYGITSGIVFVFVMLVPYTFITFGTLLNCTISINNISEQITELNEISKLKTERRSEPVLTLDEIRNIKFKDVSYTNVNNEYVVNKVSFELKRGERLGVLALDNETKDAVFDLMTKLIKPKSGSICINDCDINKISTSYLRNIITSIFNHNPIIDDSICENIIYPLDYDDYKYNDALYKSKLKDVVNKYSDADDTNIYSSEIEKDLLYRVIFANAFFKDSKIYLFKDSNGEISPSLEVEMMDEVLKLKNKMVIGITSKAYYLNNYDKIIILKNGEVIEYGSYNDLINDKNSYFYKFMRKTVDLDKKEKIS